MNVIVTGGAGFIGSHVVDLLLERGDQVAVVDNLSSGKRTNLNPGASLFELDVRSPDLETAFRQFRPEAVFHLAAQVSVKLSVDAPVEDAEVNIKGTVNLLDQCRAFGVRRLVYISTGGALYGEPEWLPCTEEHPVNPLSPYGVSKYAAEKYVELYGRLYGLEYTILRFANVYGPRQDPHGEAGVVAIFSRRMLSGQEVIIFGDGRQERDFVYVEDAARACVTALERGSGQAFNIGTGVGSTVNQVFNGLRKFTDYQLDATYFDSRPEDIYRIFLEASKAHRELGWEPRVTLDEGLRRTLDFFRER
jgi:UDP-glucose 4-epimerase